MLPEFFGHATLLNSLSYRHDVANAELYTRLPRLEQKAMLPLDDAAVSAKALPALLADRFGSAARPVQFILYKYPIPSYPPPQPRVKGS
jgi:hypothetical protein